MESKSSSPTRSDAKDADSKSSSPLPSPDAKSSSSESLFTCVGLEIDNGSGPLSSGFDLDLSFRISTTSVTLTFALEYLVDGMLRRHVVPLLRTDPEEYVEGLNSVLLEVENVNVSSIEPGKLANAGLLSVRVYDDREEVCIVNCVVMVEERNGEFERVIYNPFE